MTSTHQVSPTEAPSKSRAERVIETLAARSAGLVVWLAEHGVLFAVFAVIWLAVVAGLAFSSATVDELWRTIGTMPLVAQIALWVLFLPVMAGLWVWEGTLPELVRLLIVLALAGWTLLIFRPKWLRWPSSDTGATSKS